MSAARAEPARAPASGRQLAGWLGPLGVAVACEPVLQSAILHPETPGPRHLGAWLAAVATFVIADQVAVRGDRTGTRVAALAVATTMAVTAIWLIPVVYGGAALTATLLVVVAARLHSLRPAVAWSWIVLQSLLLLYVYVDRWKFEVGASAAFGFFGFQVIGYRFLGTAAAEARSRAALRRALDALSQTRGELLDAARRAERNQIAADLHDVLGHHLVALQLQLEAAKAPGAPGSHVVHASRLARLLLAEVRGVVDEMRDRAAFDLVAELHHLVSEDTRPRVRVEVVEATRMCALEPRAAKECFRAVQEAVTNARKHAGASLVTVRVLADGIEVEDDGASWIGPSQGRGLSGMADRCRAAGCAFALDRRPGEGTTVRIVAPAGPGPDAEVVS